MTDFNNIKKLPLDRLITLYNTLRTICIDCDTMMKPLNNSHNQSDRAMWEKYRTEFQEAKMHLNIVSDALKVSLYGYLENPPVEEKVEKPKIAKKPVTEGAARRGRPKKKEAVK